MKRSILIPVIGITAGIMVLLMFWRYSGETPQRPDDVDGRASELQRETGAAPSAESNQLASEPTAKGPDKASPQHIGDLELALEAASNERRLAEAALQESESAVAELERFVEEIEARGEDPADYADEGLEKFIPAFDAYQRAADRLEIAEQMELDAQRALEDARSGSSSRHADDENP